MDTEVRAVDQCDVPAVVALVTEVLAEFGLVFGKGATTDDELHDLPQAYAERGGAFWVATMDRVIVGTCGVFPVAAGTYELRKMYLRPETRGHGLGARMLDVSITWARARGGSLLVLDTVEEMTTAIAFYEAHGFVRDDAQRRGARCTRGYTLQL